MIIDIKIAICDETLDDIISFSSSENDVMTECVMDTDEIAFVWNHPDGICIELKSGKSVISDYNYSKLRSILKKSKNNC